MHVTSLAGRLAVAAGALGITALTTGLTGTGIAAASVPGLVAGGAVAGGSVAGGVTQAGPTAAGATGPAGVLASAAVLASTGGLALVPAKVTLGHWPDRAGTRAAARVYGYPYPHPPACTNGGKCVADKWSFYRGQCTSWVAYRLNQRAGIGFTNQYGGQGRWGDAVRWGPKAKKLGIKVNTTPTVGAIAWYSATKPAPDGHVAYVEKVNSPTSFVMSEMNYDADNGFWVHTIKKATGDWPTEFIHFTRLAPR
jgi:surface antigen